MKILASTKLNTLPQKEFKKLLKESINFCTQNLGLNKRKVMSLQVVWNKNKTYECYGWYNAEENLIQINGDCETVTEFTRAMIHEWTHHLQPILSKYEKLYKQHGYNNHPMEIEAYAAEKKWNRKMLSYLKSL